MQHITTLADLSLQNAWVTIGSFDGVHRGHQAIIRSMVDAAHAAGEPALVITFFPHPGVLLRNIHHPLYLTTPEERVSLLEKLGVNITVTLTFTRLLAEIPAHEFMRLVVARSGMKSLWVGADFALGRDREGNVTRLAEIGAGLGYHVRIFPALTENDEKISSTKIRALLESGAVDKAAALLGRSYSVTGKVVVGDKRGHRLGFPTANLACWEQRLIPAGGVYASWVWAEGWRLPSVTNVGTRPTFEYPPSSNRVETHILDFNGDLYDQELTLEFVRRLRPERKFSSIDELTGQIRQDILIARQVLPDDPQTPGLSA